MTEQCAQSTIDLQVGDFVCFERIGAERDWRNTIGKILSFPTSQRARVVWFDRSDVSPQSIPIAEEKLRVVAEREGKLSEWETMQELLQQLRQAMEEEDGASASLFKARDVTLQCQSEASAATRVAMEALDRAREGLQRVPQRQWRDVRSPGRPTEELMSLARAMLCALLEDRVTSWEAVQTVMRQADFMDRVMFLDCAAAPLSKQRRKKILAEISAHGGSRGIAAPSHRRASNAQGSMARSATGSMARRSESAALRSGSAALRSGSAALRSGSAALRSESTALRSESVPQGTHLEMAVREWLYAQIACSEARETEDAVVDGCFAELQEQAVLVREVNSMRENISMLQEKLIEIRKHLCTRKSFAQLLLGDKAHKMDAADTLFYQRNDVARRPVTEIITQKAILANFGSKEEETDSEGGLVYVCLSAEEVAALRSVISPANEHHDVQELEELFASSDREDEEIRDLHQRMEELRRKEDFTEDDEEEMRQLDVLLTDVIRRHEVTLWRIRQLQAAGRDKLFLEMRHEAGLVRSQLQVKFSGEHWEDLIADDRHRESLEAAFQRDVSKAFGVPVKNISDIRFTLEPFLVDFTLKHSRDIDAETVQSLANEAAFTEFMSYYRQFAHQRTYPLNTLEQIKAYKRSQEYATLMNFAGAGVTEDIKEFENSEEGETDDEDYRRPQIELAQVRIDYDATARYGYPLYTLTDLPDIVIQVEREEREARDEREINEIREAREAQAREAEAREAREAEAREAREAEAREAREAEAREAEAVEDANSHDLHGEEKEYNEQRTESDAHREVGTDEAGKDSVIGRPSDDYVEYPQEPEAEETKDEKDDLREL